MEKPVHFGKRVRELRIRQNLTRQPLAEKCREAQSGAGRRRGSSDCRYDTRRDRLRMMSGCSLELQSTPVGTTVTVRIPRRHIEG